MVKLGINKMSYLFVLAVAVILLVAAPAMAGGGGGGGGVRTANVPWLSVEVVAAVQLVLAAGYAVWRRRR